ncbi:hypothetical protein ElyMa_005709400 [Elysia marginata]|uniref:Uncharacterized protein n=1 Tax=Elysia marginata TaxID=1093978 RepID=A0AAV4FH65_9GAST|nr:hypothetical protein ElyMa_005709400 [Elysia marginata]
MCVCIHQTTHKLRCHADSVYPGIKSGINQFKLRALLLSFRDLIGIETAAVNLSSASFLAAENNNDASKRKEIGLRLSHPTIASLGERVLFMLQDTSEAVSRLSVNYGNDIRDDIPCFGTRCSWSRHFDVPGVYSVDLSLYGRPARRRGRPLRSALVVEEPIKGLHIRGPSEAAIGW